MTRAVFDCMVFLQAAARPEGPAGACFEAARDGRVGLMISGAILDEVRDVLARPKTLRKFPALTAEAVDLFLDEVRAMAVMVPDVPRIFALARDPKDEPYINLALVSGAVYLVSRDRDLLDLMGDDGFRRQTPDLTILDPVAFLREVLRD